MALRPTPHASHVLDRDYRQPPALVPRIGVRVFCFGTPGCDE
jgi:hypothetical protein